MVHSVSNKNWRGKLTLLERMKSGGTMEAEITNDNALTISGGPMGMSGSVEIKEIPLNKIKLAKNSRMNVTDDEIAGLMASIKETGLLQPIGVTKSGAGFEIVYGNRRFMAVSKLGKSKIPAVIHANKNEAQNDIQNLTENLQRRNISLTEAGRYMNLLQKQGLTPAEIAARLGVTKSYVSSCMVAYSEVPERFRNDLEVKTTNDRKKSAGKITISAASAIVNAGKSYGLTRPQKEFLFSEAKTNPEFATENVKKYAAAIKEGKKDPIQAVPKIRKLAVPIWIEQQEYDRLYDKHVFKGNFRSVNELIIAVIKGEKSERIKLR